MYRLGVLLLFLATCSADSGCCHGVGCFNDSPPFDHLLLPECPEALSIETNVFTRSYPVVGELLTRTHIPNVFSAKRRTVFLVHGWMSHASSHWMADITRALLKKGDHNVITVHWDSAQLVYPQSASDTRSVGAEVSLRVKLLVGAGGAERTNIWCVGHSLGAHVCGHAGKRIPFGRITGLDPAGPMFELYNNKAGLQKTDADFVDVIHTNGVEAIVMAMGLLKPLGHVDFYPNGGGLQPGCFIDPVASNEGKDKDVSMFGDIGPACSHRRAVQLYYESITSNCKFESRMICMDPYDIPSSCRPCGDKCQTMGYDAYTQPGRGLFYLETDWLAPFCLHETW